MNAGNRKHTCICGKGLRQEFFSRNFDQYLCDKCKSSRFISSGNATNDFNYNSSNDKYNDDSYLHGKVKRWSHDIIARRDWNNKTVLEVGCFNGFFVRELIDLGADAFGTDLNSHATKVGVKTFDLDGRLFNDISDIPDGLKFDCIILIDLLEHVDSPSEEVGRFKDYLKVAGEIIIAGPTVERGLHDRSDYPPHHKWLFSRPGLTDMLTSQSFKVIDIEIESNFLLYIRNKFGVIFGRHYSKEYYGSGSVLTPNKFLEGMYKIMSSLINPLFKIFGFEYCSTIVVAQRK